MLSAQAQTRPEPFTHCYKGAAVREFLAWFEETFGREAIRSALRRLPPGQARLFDQTREHYGVLHAGWYPASAFNALLDNALERVPAVTQASLAEAAAEAAAGRTLRGIYGNLLRLLGTPALYAKHAQKVWDTYHNGGRLVVALDGDGRAISSVSRWSGHHPFLCRVMGEAGALVFSSMNLRDVRSVRLSCVADGARACSFLTTWHA
jgi:hypothetical protein